jgi:hypothetical protein
MYVLFMTRAQTLYHKRSGQCKPHGGGQRVVMCFRADAPECVVQKRG